MFDQLPTATVLISEPDGLLKLHEYDGVTGFALEESPVAAAIEDMPQDAQDRLSPLKQGEEMDVLTGRSCFLCYVISGTIIYVDLLYSSDPGNDNCKKFVAEALSQLQDAHQDKTIVWIANENDAALAGTLQYIDTTIIDSTSFGQ
jgi:hypothetical protein